MDKRPDNTQGKIFPLSHLAVISVSGNDSAKFLQGQLTCDIYGLSHSQASIAAFCNPKGRAISTLFVVKTDQAFLLILPVSLLPKVLQKLQMYILRSAVRLSDESANLPVFGIDCPPSVQTTIDLPSGDFAVSSSDEKLIIKLPSADSRYLFIGNESQSLKTLSQHLNLKTGETGEWLYQDISSGLPWFEISQSEVYIPQMLNIDQLGGISFNKGCYTGQEIIARTHYLGKAKRSLFPAESDTPLERVDSSQSVLDQESQQTAGKVLSAQTYAQNTRMLIVLQTEGVESRELVLDDAKRTSIKIVATP